MFEGCVSLDLQDREVEFGIQRNLGKGVEVENKPDLIGGEAVTQTRAFPCEGAGQRLGGHRVAGLER